MPHYMAELVLTDRPVLLVGGGRVAERKLSGLLTCDAQVFVLSPQLTPAIELLAQQQKIHYIQTEFKVEMLTHHPAYLLVFAATNQKHLNQYIARECAKLGLLCNSADEPDVSGFLVPATIRQGPVTVGIGTEGQSPALSRLLKEQIEVSLSPGWGALARLFGAMRNTVKEQIGAVENRQDFWRQTALAAARENRPEKPDNQAWFDQRLQEARSAADPDQKRP
ncbi:MAG: bifunctional precorrin-2 dehydrogenase/sirohydrochlorin ferrochelatase [Magnetococcales bacterium]|nr:bifunctional precorrin-2 dehydrogenase/sirohydrochlorin ferrochelatase [Magnetococcales bacterium]